MIFRLSPGGYGLVFLEGTFIFGVITHIFGWVVVSKIFYFHPYLGKIPILTHIFQRGWNHQLDIFGV